MELKGKINSGAGEQMGGYNQNVLHACMDIKFKFNSCTYDSGNKIM